MHYYRKMFYVIIQNLKNVFFEDLVTAQNAGDASTFSKITFSIRTLSIMTLNVMTLSVMTLKHNDTQHDENTA